MEEPDHTTTPDHTTCIEVFTENPDQFLKKTYNAETKSWSDSPVFRFAEIDLDGNVIEVRRSVFEHEVSENCIPMPDGTTHLDKYIEGQWVAYVEPVVEDVPPLEAVVVINNDVVSQ